eukprot:107929-Pleurochrysis_carterae.AAC.1
MSSDMSSCLSFSHQGSSRKQPRHAKSVNHLVVLGPADERLALNLGGAHYEQVGGRHHSSLQVDSKADIRAGKNCNLIWWLQTLA